MKEACPDCKVEVSSKQMKYHRSSDVCLFRSRHLDQAENRYMACTWCNKQVRNTPGGISAHMRNINQCRILRDEQPLQHSGFRYIHGTRYKFIETGEYFNIDQPAAFQRILFQG